MHSLGEKSEMLAGDKPRYLATSRYEIKGGKEDQCEVPQTRNRNWSKLKKRLPSIALQDVDDKDGKDVLIDTSSIIFSMQECIIVICIYLTIGVLSFSFIFEKWSIGDSLYFTVVTLTTVGYGDFVPSSHASKHFLCLFCLTGVALIGVTLGEIAAYVIDMEQKALDSVNQLSKIHIIGEVNNDNFTKEDDAVHREIQLFWYYFFKIIFVRFFPCQLILCTIAYYFVLNGKEDYTEVFYYLMITSLSIGYGDIIPPNSRERMIASIIILVSVGSMGDLVANVMSLVIRHRKLRKLQKLQSLEEFLKNIKKMDVLGDGKVDMCEYFEFMLLCLGLVEKDLMDQMRKSFRKMDQSNKGFITKEDLKILHKKLLTSTKKKLELSRYKRHLKAISSSSLAHLDSSLDDCEDVPVVV